MCTYGFAITTFRFLFRNLYVIFTKPLRCFECMWLMQTSVVFQIWNRCPWSWGKESTKFSIYWQFYYQKAPCDPIKSMNTHILCFWPLIRKWRLEIRSGLREVNGKNRGNQIICYIFTRKIQPFCIFHIIACQNIFFQIYIIFTKYFLCILLFFI